MKRKEDQNKCRALAIEERKSKDHQIKFRALKIVERKLKKDQKNIER